MCWARRCWLVRVCVEKVGGVQCDDSDFTGEQRRLLGWRGRGRGQTFTPGQTRTWVVRGTVDPAAANNASLTNSASASSSTTADPAPGDESASADTTIVTRADLHVSNAVVALGTPVVSGSVVAGNGVQYTLSVTNDGPSNAAGVSVSDVLGSQVLAGARVCEKLGGVQCDDSDFTANSGAFSGGVVVEWADVYAGADADVGGAWHGGSGGGEQRVADELGERVEFDD